MLNSKYKKEETKRMRRYKIMRKIQGKTHKKNEKIKYS